MKRRKALPQERQIPVLNSDQWWLRKEKENAAVICTSTRDNPVEMEAVQRILKQRHPEINSIRVLV